MNTSEISTEQKRQLVSRYRTRVSARARKLMAKAEDDSLARQILPSALELMNLPGFSRDPLSEEDPEIHPLPWLIHKYPDKVLFLTTDECPVYCRFCTRKRRTLIERNIPSPDLAAIRHYISGQPQIREMIFSGGDPLMLPTERLSDWLSEISSWGLLRDFRFHSRCPTMAPRQLERHLPTLLTLRGGNRALVCHINHPAELRELATESLDALRENGWHILSQSVLLRGINDDAAVLSELIMRLDEAGIRPYYLHQLDRIEGSVHFEVPESEGRRLMARLRRLVPPYLLFRYVRDSKEGKINLAY